MTDQKKNLNDFPQLPSQLTNSDVSHVNRGGKDYKADQSEYLLQSELVNDVENADSTKPASAASVNSVYLDRKWQNRADGILFVFDSVWQTERQDKQVSVTIPAGTLMDIDSSTKLNFQEQGTQSLLDGGAIVMTISGSSVTFDFIDDASQFVETEDRTKFIIVKNVGGIVKSRLPSVENYLYESQQSITELSWDFDSSIVEADPGAGNFRMNNSDPSLVTEIYFSEESQQEQNVKEILTTANVGSNLQIIQVSNATKSILCNIDAIVDNSTYVTYEVSVLDYGSIFDNGAECSTNLYYEQSETTDDISRNYQETAVSASNINVDFANKNEAWTTKTGGGGVVVDENITVGFVNGSDKKTANLFLEVTTSTRVITLDSSIISNDSRFNGSADELTLDPGDYLLRFNFDGDNNTQLEVLPKEQASSTADVTRNYTEVAVAADEVAVDFASKKEAWVQGVGRGNISVSSNIDLIFSNDSEKHKAWVFLTLSGDYTVGVPSTFNSNDIRYNAGTISLEAGTYCIIMTFSGDNDDQIQILPDLPTAHDLGFALSDETSDLTTDNDAEIQIIRNQRIENITIAVNTAPVGSAIVVDVKRNAATFNTVTLPAGSTTVTVSESEPLAVGDRLSADITQVGSTTAGAGAKIYFNTKLT